MYTFDAIILEKNIIREKHIRIVVLTQEFGKITLWYYKNLTGVDIGDIARIVVRRENSINSIKSIETKHYLMKKKWNFDSLYAFLGILKTLKFCFAMEENASSVFADYCAIFHSNNENISQDACRLFQMRIFKQLGTLNPEFFRNDAILHYIYKKIDTTPLERILRSQPLKDEHKSVIDTSNLFSFSTFV